VHTQQLNLCSLSAETWNKSSSGLCHLYASNVNWFDLSTNPQQGNRRPRPPVSNTRWVLAGLCRWPKFGCDLGRYVFYSLFGNIHDAP